MPRGPGQCCLKIPQYSRLIHRMQMVFSRLLEGSGGLRNEDRSADNDGHSMSFSERNVGVVYFFVWLVMTQHWSGPLSDQEPQPHHYADPNKVSSELRDWYTFIYKDALACTKASFRLSFFPQRQHHPSEYPRILSVALHSHTRPIFPRPSSPKQPESCR
jgi:hypothetical protein